MIMRKGSDSYSVLRYGICILLLFLCVNAVAQRVTVGRKGGRGYESGRYSVSAMYNIMWIEIDKDNDITGNGVSLEILDRAYITPAEAFMVEWGLRGTYIVSDDKYNGLDADLKYAFLSLPVNFRLEINKKGSGLVVSPLLGVMLRWNLMGEHEIRDGGRTISVDYFGNENERVFGHSRWERIRFGWQIGMSIDYKWLHTAVLYDFHGLSFALGMNF